MPDDKEENDDMPLTLKGQEIMSKMVDEYGSKAGQSIFYASRNKGTINGVDPQSMGGRIDANRSTKKSAPKKQKVKYL